jgi:uncharacterized membrane protein YsdA (DUF1294 family)
MESVLWSILIVIGAIGAILGIAGAIQMARSPYRDR